MTIGISVTLDGQAIPCKGFDISGGSHGSVGSCSITSSIKAITDAGIDVVKIGSDNPSGAPLIVRVTTDQGGQQNAFSGEYLSASWSYRNDTIMLHARDKAGRMVDQKRVFTSGMAASASGGAPDTNANSSGISNTNQTVSQLVSAIANQFGLSPIVNLAAAADVPIGALFGDATEIVLTTVPQSVWGFLTRLARENGAEVYVTPQDQLVVQKQGMGDKLAFSWGTNPPPDGVLPLLDLNVVHNARRNGSFKVGVLSYDPTVGKTTKGTSSVGKDGGAAYTFHSDGLTQAQATTKAKAIAKDISKRAFTVQIMADYIPNLRANLPATLQGSIDPAFVGQTFYVHQWSHKFEMSETTGDLSSSATLLTNNASDEGD